MNGSSFYSISILRVLLELASFCTLIFNNPFVKRQKLAEEAERKAEEERQRKRALNRARKTGRNVKL